MRIRPVTIAVLVIGLGVFVGPGFAPQPQTRAFGPSQAPLALPQRHALVVGNDAYPGASALRNAVADATAIEAALRDLGFRVEVVRNATQESFERAVDRFVANVQPGDMALFYYSGHGLEARGENYLLPVDFAALDEVQVKRRAIAAGEIEERLHERGARVRILVLDACRDNPYRAVRSGAGGLVAMAEARGALIAFATAPGKTASDNPGGKNGLFTQELLALLREPDLTVSEVFRRVRERVDRLSGAQQTPWVADGLIGDIVLRPVALASAVPGAAPATPVQAAGGPPATLERGAATPPPGGFANESSAPPGPLWRILANPLTWMAFALIVAVAAATAAVVMRQRRTRRRAAARSPLSVADHGRDMSADVGAFVLEYLARRAESLPRADASLRPGLDSVSATSECVTDYPPRSNLAGAATSSEPVEASGEQIPPPSNGEGVAGKESRPGLEPPLERPQVWKWAAAIGPAAVAAVVALALNGAFTPQLGESVAPPPTPQGLPATTPAAQQQSPPTQPQTPPPVSPQPEQAAPEPIAQAPATVPAVNERPAVSQAGSSSMTPIRLGTGVGARLGRPKQTKTVNPIYPDLAPASRVEGFVIVEITVAADGKVQDARVIHSIAPLDQAALDAARQWEFAPSVLDGVPVPIIMTVPVRFKLPK